MGFIDLQRDMFNFFIEIILLDNTIKNYLQGNYNKIKINDAI